MAASKHGQAHKRAVRIANCSGANSDPGYQMLRQATQGPVDFITGDYLAELNIGDNAVAMKEGRGVGYAPTAWDGIERTVSVLAEKKIKLIIDGGGLNPEGLARRTQELVDSKGLKLTVAWVTGDDVLPQVREQIEKNGTLPRHLDAENDKVLLARNARDLLKPGHELVTANAYLGARAIVKALEAGADIIICGRVADASPVIGAAWYWHGWKDTDHDRLAGAFIGGHLIECSAYLTGGNFSGFDELPLDDLIDLPFGLCEVEHDGTVVATKHENTKGVVNIDTVRAQLLYELQGNVYLNSDVAAYLDDIRVESVGKDRVRVSGVRGAPPPPTTKLAITYQGGYESQVLANAAGYGVANKFALFKKQLEFFMKRNEVYDKMDVFEVQQIGIPERNPRSQASSTVYFRVLAQAEKADTVQGVLRSYIDFLMQHFSGWHCSWDLRTAFPRPFLAYWPAIIAQDELKEAAHIIRGGKIETISAGHPSVYKKLDPRASYDTSSPISLEGLGETRTVRLGDIALGRSGDKGANINLGLYIRGDDRAWDWFRTFMSRDRITQLLGDDWRPKEHFVERVELPHIHAVHFVLYGMLGRGVSSATTLDNLGKGLADYVRAKEIEVPVSVLSHFQEKKTVPLAEAKL
ncbi:hypothetical protein ANO11243_061500 [Dothideomycetidae sp. 11243]|nr:hypothetical protein ANO11243_061500 [fungal sp. No.11243]